MTLMSRQRHDDDERPVIGSRLSGRGEKPPLYRSFMLERERFEVGFARRASRVSGTPDFD